MAFPPLENSNHVVVSVSIDFQSNAKLDSLFHRVANDYSRADLDGLRDYLRDVSLEDIFKFSASAASGEFFSGLRLELMYLYSSSQVLDQASLISVVFRCLCCYRSS